MPNCNRPWRDQMVSLVACWPRSASLGVGVATTPRGLVSVMPHSWQTATPYLVWNVSAMARGTAEPPITSRARLPESSPLRSRCARYIVQMVGTPPDRVTPSLLISSCRLAPSILSHGRTNLQPLIAAANGRPQAVP